MLLFGRRKGLPIGTIVSVPAGIENRYVPGSGVGASNIAVRRHKLLKATPVKKQPIIAPTVTYGSMSFDGITSNLFNADGITVGASAFSFEGYFYLTTDLTGNRMVIFGANYAGPASGGLSISILTDTQINIDNLGISSTTFTVSTIVKEQWFHLAVVRNSSNEETVFLNGVRSTDGVITDSITYTATNYIGCWNSGGNGNDGLLAGNLAGVRLVIGSTAYDPQSATITVPPQPLPNITDTVLLLNTPNNGDYIKDTSVTNTIFVNNNVGISTAHP
jgi:hypothetical protein